LVTIDYRPTHTLSFKAVYCRTSGKYYPADAQGQFDPTNWHSSARQFAESTGKSRGSIKRYTFIGDKNLLEIEAEMDGEPVGMPLMRIYKGVLSSHIARIMPRYTSDFGLAPRAGSSKMGARRTQIKAAKPGKPLGMPLMRIYKGVLSSHITRIMPGCTSDFGPAPPMQPPKWELGGSRSRPQSQVNLLAYLLCEFIRAFYHLTSPVSCPDTHLTLDPYPPCRLQNGSSADPDQGRKAR
jgi:hypothetical protein